MKEHRFYWFRPHDRRNIPDFLLFIAVINTELSVRTMRFSRKYLGGNDATVANVVRVGRTTVTISLSLLDSDVRSLS
jgi:hypothetical protein